MDNTDPTLRMAGSTAMPSVHFAKIAATPTELAWSQAYNAGTLFAVVSVSETEKTPDTSLSVIGKEIISTLEEEFFTLEEKSLTSIKQALEAVIDKIPQGIETTLLVASLPRTSPTATQTKKDNVVYLFIYGQGKILLKRLDKTATFGGEQNEMRTSSGILENGDILLLHTNPFASVVDKEKLSEALAQQSPSDIAEMLAPIVHEKEEGAACAIVISYAAPQHEWIDIAAIAPKTATISLQENDQESSTPETSFSLQSFLPTFLPRIPGSKRLILIVAVFLGVILLSSIYFARQKQQQQQSQTVLANILEPAQKKYDEGKSILSLNKNLARRDFEDAKKLLDDGKKKLKAGSNEEKKLDVLLAQVEASLQEASGINKVQTQEVSSDKSPLLAFEIKNPANYTAYDDKNYYVATSDGISSFDKTAQNPKTVVKKDWKSLKGLGAYLGNLYVLDVAGNAVLKFAGAGFTKTNYLTSSVDVSKGIDLTIDGSVWILLSDGNIIKLTRGKVDPFVVSGIDTPLTNAAKIYTNPDSTALYILSKSQHRIMVLKKEDGSFQTQYQADILKSAKDFDVNEKDKKIYVLSGGKIYSIDIK